MNTLAPTGVPRVHWQDLARELDQRLAAADADLAGRYPGDRAGRQPVHTVYVPADRYTHEIVPAWGLAARAAVDRHRQVFTDAVGDDAVERVLDKLAREPIEDLRIDFEDGYSSPGDRAEDRDAAAAAGALARSVADGTAAPFRGIRFNSFEQPTRARGLRTLAVFLECYLGAAGTLDGFVVTLPKVTSVDQVEAMTHAAARFEDELELPPRTLRFEIQVETPQSILGPDGTALVARMIHASGGRCTALHYGTYDYSAFCGIAAGYQSMEHPAADHAKLVMQAAAAGTGVRLSDGSTNVLPVGTPSAVRDAWLLHLRLVRRSLERGYYQGWDLHPAQLPTRFAATFAFYRDGLGPAVTRLRNWLEQAGGGILDEPATARALADFLLRGVWCGAVTELEAAGSAGLTLDQLTELARPTR